MKGVIYSPDVLYQYEETWHRGVICEARRDLNKMVECQKL